jgi:uncharacterized protein YukE
MDTLVYAFSEHLAALLIVFVILFLGISYLFTKEKLPQFILGLVKVFASIFYAPFIKVKNTILMLAEFGEKGESTAHSSKQYLLGKIILVFESILIILSISVVSSGIITGWHSFLPSKYLRESADQYEQMIDETNEKLSEISSQITKFEDSWEENKTTVIKEAKDRRNKIISDLKGINKQLELSIPIDASTSEVFTNVKSYLESNASITRERDIREVDNSATRYVNNEYSITEESRTHLRSYINNWIQIKNTTIELGSLTDEVIRFEYQPEYANLKSGLDSYQDRIRSQTENLKSVNDQMIYDFEAFIKIIILSILLFIVIIWVVGGFIELLNLNVDLAGNVNKLRILKEDEKKS